jgi:hypothetical protein
VTDESQLVSGTPGNETSTVVRSPTGAHRVRLVDKLSPEMVLLHQSGVYLFNLKMRDGVPITPVPLTTIAQLVPRY